MKLRYFSVCSGIEAATVAWSPLGFTAAAFSEVEPFPCAVLAHHYPEVPNLGDMTRINGATYRGLVDILVGGTPCQAFSVAGLRQGLEDARGNLTLTFLELANAIDPAFVVWENVPGVLSDKTNAFGCLLGGLVGADNALENVGRWPNCGVVRGPRRTAAWRVLDAQYFGLAQRRQRVFLVACPRNGADPAEVLFERQGVQRHSAPSREAGEGFTHDVALCIGASGRGFERGGDTRGQDPVVASCVTGSVTHALKAEGFDASEDGTGRGQPIICQDVAFHPTQDPISSTDGTTHALGCGSTGGTCTAAVMTLAILGRGEESNLEIRQDGTANALLTPNGGRGGIGVGAVAIGFNGDQSEKTRSMGTVEGQSPTLRRDGPAHVAVAFPIQECHVSRANLKGTGTGLGGEGDPMFTLQSAQPHGVATAMQVRRLTPRECERLQGFPDDYTLIPTAKAKKIEEDMLTYYLAAHPELTEEEAARLAADGPRYKALGNSMAVPCMRWIGERIKAEAQRVGLQERDPLPLLAAGEG